MITEHKTIAKTFALGLVVGKFAPLHLGHEWLIRQADLRCDRLLILSYANPEFDRCNTPNRRRWFAARLPQHEALVIDAALLAQLCAGRGSAVRPLPQNDSSDAEQQNFLAWLLTDILKRTPDAIFCSETYGPSCASVLTKALGHNVAAVVMDPDRNQMPVHAAQIRQNPYELRRWMAPEVAAAFVRRIVLLGGESSGKTTLAAALAAHYETTWVHEYGRELWEQQHGEMSEEDLLKVGHEQIRREQQALSSANGYLFCDTSPLTTAGYGLWMFGRVQPELANLAAREYDAIILCKPDFPFVQDGSRREEAFRDQQYAWYLQQTATLRCPVLKVAGTVPERVSSVAQWLSELPF
ncbi:MAG TPA: AAA family ATPase [Steroidobacteraceae bacterium]|nr:AAA family ATPase [Steroidobacteraceae bacterium]